jgi:hypothetical protein
MTQPLNLKCDILVSKFGFSNGSTCTPTAWLQEMKANKAMLPSPDRCSPAGREARRAQYASRAEGLTPTAGAPVHVDSP